MKLSGIDSVECIRKYTGRSPVVHLKDYVGEKPENMYELIGLESVGDASATSFGFRPPGGGIQNIASIIAVSEKAGMQRFVVEQDEPFGNTALEDAEASIRYIKTYSKGVPKNESDYNDRAEKKRDPSNTNG